jgi:uncharacterized protein (DUF1778 family)
MLKDTKFTDVRVTQQLKDETILASKIDGRNLSEYIREAVREKNKKVIKEGKK